MMANPFDQDYGTVSGQSTGFKSKPGAQEFGALKQQIAGKIMVINQQTQSLRQLSAQIGSRSDNESLRTRIHRLLKDTMEKVQSARGSLGELFQMVQENPEQGQQLGANSLKQNMQKAANEFSSIYQTIKEKLQEFQTPPKEEDKGYLDSDNLVEMAGDRVRLIPSPSGREPEGRQQQQEFAVARETEHIEERAERMQELERDILELHGIMGDIGQMVVVQGEDIKTIEGAVETAYGEVTRANEQLDSAVRYKKCSRKLACTIFCILLIVAIIILVVIAVILAIVLKK